MSKQLLSILRRLKTSKKSSGVVEQMDSSLTVKNGKLSKDIVADMPLDKNGNLAKLAPSSVTPRRSKAFRTLLTNSSVSDVHFVIEGKTIYGQKCVLASLSEFFNAMFTGAWSESVTETTTVVEIVDFNFTTFSAMLEYLVILKHNQTEPDLFLQYLEEIDYNATLIDLGLLHLCADKYQILDLVDKTTSLISSKFSIHNISEFLFGFAYQNDDLYSLALDYFLSNFDEIRVCSEFATVIRKSWMYADSFVEILEEVFLNIVVEGFDHVEFIPEEMGDDDEGVSSDCGSQLDDCPISATTESTYACENIHTSPSVGYRSENEEFLDPVFSGDLGDDRPGFQTLDLELSSFLSNTVNSA
ncbi:hypothetical protein HDU83_000495 [Entophlyctis luteolus]|nr:hypothetical protein HDU82_007120 [Entophlyctis luteolus]KAJ3356633.1 hypothetical protein HDU83_000495 [Entophlyctis luteolus]